MRNFYLNNQIFIVQCCTNYSYSSQAPGNQSGKHILSILLMGNSSTRQRDQPKVMLQVSEKLGFCPGVPGLRALL